jgi:hypothetical protein
MAESLLASILIIQKGNGALIQVVPVPHNPDEEQSWNTFTLGLSGRTWQFDDNIGKRSLVDLINEDGSLVFVMRGGGN